jgi:hypothetical protein
MKATTPKQYNVGATETLKTLVGELAVDFTRPAAVKNAPEVKATEKEVFEMLYNVATDRRFKPTGEMIHEIDADGNQVFDADGTPSMIAEVQDLFEIEWKKILARDYSETSAVSELDKRIAQARKFSKILNSTAEEIEELVEKVKAQYDKEQAEAAAALTPAPVEA